MGRGGKEGRRLGGREGLWGGEEGRGGGEGRGEGLWGGVMDREEVDVGLEDDGVGG